MMGSAGSFDDVGGGEVSLKEDGECFGEEAFASLHRGGGFAVGPVA